MADDRDASRRPLLPEDEAIRLLLAGARPLQETVTVALAEAHGRVSAAALGAPIPLPPMDNSAMDGYALRCADLPTSGPATLPISQRIAAGDPAAPLAPGTVARILTGAPVPAGADAVVIQEACRLDGDGVVIQGPIEIGANIRRAGEDIRQGAELFPAGTRLRPQDLAVAAAVGIAEIPVFRRLRVAQFFTGSELRTPGLPLGPGQIYNSNRYLLTPLLELLGCEVIDLGDIPDDLDTTCATLREAAAAADVIITCGGVSVGDEDHVRAAVEAIGELQMWRIAVKPGKPLAYGNIAGTPFIGLPGNPVSAFITFSLYARPFLCARQGRRHHVPQRYPVAADLERPRPAERREYLRARLEVDDHGDPVARVYDRQGSAIISSITWADGLLCIPEHRTVRRGQRLDYIPFSELFG